VLGNHDKPRIASRVGPAQARVAAVLLLTLRGTPTIYQGDEIGMEDVPIPPDRIRDPLEKTRPGKGRDPVRTPMPWEAAGKANAGFTTGEPWLPLGADVATRNVAAQRADPDSLLSLYRRGIALRRAEPALAVGTWKALAAEGDLVAYERSEGGRRFAVVLNLGASATAYPLSGAGRIVLATERGREGKAVAAASLALSGNEAIVVQLD
jgi:alpha-glucosidase